MLKKWLVLISRCCFLSTVVYHTRFIILFHLYSIPHSVILIRACVLKLTIVYCLYPIKHLTQQGQDDIILMRKKGLTHCIVKNMLGLIYTNNKWTSASNKLDDISICR